MDLYLCNKIFIKFTNQVLKIFVIIQVISIFGRTDLIIKLYQIITWLVMQFFKSKNNYDISTLLWEIHYKKKTIVGQP